MKPYWPKLKPMRHILDVSDRLTVMVYPQLDQIVIIFEKPELKAYTMTIGQFLDSVEKE